MKTLTREDLIKAGEFLNSQGYQIDLTDDFWMEDTIFGEHRVKDVIKLLYQFTQSQSDGELNEVGIYKLAEEYADSNDEEPAGSPYWLGLKNGFYDGYKANHHPDSGKMVETNNPGRQEDEVITDSALSQIADQYVKSNPVNIGIRTAFAAGFKFAKRLEIQAKDSGKMDSRELIEAYEEYVVRLEQSVNFFSWIIFESDEYKLLRQKIETLKFKQNEV